MKLKKILASILALCMVLSTMGTVAFAANVTNNDELAAAVANAADGDIIYLAAGEYDLPTFSGKELTFKGLDKANVIINDAPDARKQGWNGASVHFENLTANGTTANYHGLANGIVNLSYTDCNINYLRFLYASNTVSFENCAFDSMGAEHSFWTYGASNVTVTNCTFKYTDRAVNCYSENGADHELDIAFTECTFTYTGSDEAHEGAVEINSSSVKSIEVNLDQCIGTNGETVAFNSKWDSTGGANTTINARVIAKIGDVEYFSLTDAMNAVQAGDTVTIMEGTYAMPSMKAGITVVGEGNVLLEGTLSGTLEDLTMKNLHIKGANAQRWAYAKGDLVFENVTFEATSVYALHFDGITAGTNLLYKDCTIIGWAAMGGSPASCVFDGCTIKGNGYYGVIRTYFDAKINDCTFDVENVNKNDVYQDGIHAVDTTVWVNNCTNANGDMKDILNISQEAYIYVNDELALAPEAKVGDTYYPTLQEAIEAASKNAGDYEIKVLKDIAGNVTIKQVNGVNIILDGDGKTYKGTISVNGNGRSAGKETLTIKNMNFVAEGEWQSSIETVKSKHAHNITVDNCTFSGTDKQQYGIRLRHAYNIVVKNTTGTKLYDLVYGNNAVTGFTAENITITDSTNGIWMSYVNSEATLKNLDIDVDAAGVGFVNNATGTITIEDSDIKAEAPVAMQSNNKNVSLNLDIAKENGYFESTTGGDVISVSATANGSTDKLNVDIYGGSYNSNVEEYIADGYELTRTGNGYFVIEDTDTDDEGKAQADSISIVYKDVTIEGTEGEKTYEVIVKANDGDVINELASVDLTFVYTSAPVTGGAIDFAVAPAEKFAMTRYENTNRYMFNYNGVDAWEGTANEIPVATITVTGYGSYTISTADAGTNIVNTTTLNDNLVDSYIATGATDDDARTGVLDISDKVDGDDAVIAVPTRELTINLDFPNTINGNAAAYQDMKVEITGNIDGVNKTVAYDLGETTNGSYVVTEDRLVLNNAYTVTVSGAGYRTARYTVTMTEDKTLRFWNNVMDEKQFVEIGKESSKVNVTFLAGDIVKDNNINIYDLSAVVSYFGQTNDTTAYSNYAKYDLNRDGVIDSKDVAYVLVSWNN